MSKPVKFKKPSVSSTTVQKKKLIEDEDVDNESFDSENEFQAREYDPKNTKFRIDREESSDFEEEDSDEDFDPKNSVKKGKISNNVLLGKRKAINVPANNVTLEEKAKKIKRIVKTNTITDFKSSTKLNRQIDPKLQIEVVQQLRELENYWSLNNTPGADLTHLVKCALDIGKDEILTPIEVETRMYNNAISPLVVLKAKFLAYNLLRVFERIDDQGQNDGDGSVDDEEDDAIRECSLKLELRFNKLAGMMTHACESYLQSTMYHHYEKNESDWNVNGGTHTFFRYAFPDPEEVEKMMNSTSKLLVACLNKSLELGLRRIGTDTYIPKYYNGFHTNCWIYYKPIREFVFDQLNCMQTNPGMFFSTFNQGTRTVDQVAKVLEGIACPQFPPLVVSQYVTAWRNGNYNIFTDKFEYYDKNHRQAILSRHGESLEDDSQDMDIVDPTGKTTLSQDQLPTDSEENRQPAMTEEEKTHYKDMLDALEKAFPDYSGTFRGIRKQLSGKEEALLDNVKTNNNYHFAAHAFIDQEFQYVPDVRNPENIRLKYFDSILDAQGMSKGVKRWLKISLGRMFFPAKSVNGESWEYAPFLIGYSGTGKSTILKFLQYFYRPEEIGLVSNNIERQWAMGTLAAAGVLVIIGSEVRSDLKLDQAEFMQAVSNEMMLIMKKNQMAKTSSFFTIPIIMAMNNMIKGWQNNTGNLARRILFIEFDRYVKKADIKPNLLEEMKKEASLFIQQVTRMYKKMTETHGKEDLWKIVPKELVETSKKMFQNTSPFLHFLSQPNIVYGSTEYIKYKEFMLEFKNFCEDKNYNFSRIRLTDDLWKPPLEQLGVVIEDSDASGTKWKTDDYIFRGIGIRVETQNQPANMVPVTSDQ